MLTFVSLPLSELVQGTKYRIEENLYGVREIIFIGMFNGYQQHNEGKYLLWKKIFYFIKNGDEEVIIPKYIEETQMDILSPFGRKYFKLISSKEKIQNEMEIRAINLILQNIIGDKTFSY
uniref:Uncharacterized protein n=1 Tax=viral metagenome TaxID=1070528 RepID=A0A6C0EV84_9ZZZZ